VNAPRAAVIAVLVLVAIVVETALLARTSLPGPTPDLIALVVIGVAITLGANAGAATGFFAGLAVALAPPFLGPVGLAAIGYAVVGYLVGSYAAGEHLARGEMAGLAAGAGAALATAGALLAGFWGGGWTGPVELVVIASLQALYCGVLGIFVTPAVGALVGAVPGRVPA
jgi:rod shape-determining protein MreD